jgi:hypothetical protein
VLSAVLHRGRYLYCAVLLGGLFALQVFAQGLQLRSGFRPFLHAPTRVPYSWDMFAIHIDRCVVGWDPPLYIDGEQVSRWHDRLPSLEFDTVFNDVDWYEAAAARGCEYKTAARTVTRLTCFSGDGGVHEFGYYCP